MKSFCLENTERGVLRKEGCRLRIFIILSLLIFLDTGCARYPFNPSLKQIDRQSGCRAKFRDVPDNSEALVFFSRMGNAFFNPKTPKMA